MSKIDKNELAKIVLRSFLLKKGLKERLLREIPVKDEIFLLRLKALLLSSEENLTDRLASNGVNAELLGKEMDRFLNKKMLELEIDQNEADLAAMEEKLK